MFGYKSTGSHPRKSAITEGLTTREAKLRPYAPTKELTRGYSGQTHKLDRFASLTRYLRRQGNPTRTLIDSVKAVSWTRALLTVGTILVISGFLTLTTPPQTANAHEVTFMWDANTEADLAGYRLYQSSVSGTYTIGKGNEAAEIPAPATTITLKTLPDGTYFWVLTAFSVNGLESGPSNQVSAVLAAPPPTQAPSPPGAFKIQIIITGP